jgi:hypothetical protein
MQPSLSALLRHDSIRSPRCQCVVETFVGRSHGLLGRERSSSVIETRQVAHSVITGCRHNPRVATIAQRVAESLIVLEKIGGSRIQRSIHGVPVDRICQIDIEIRDYRRTLNAHVSGRCCVSCFNVLQLLDQCLLRRASRTRIPLDRTLVHHDGESKARMIFRLSHNQSSGLIDSVIRTVPINDHSVDPSADHVLDLAFDLCGVGRTIPNIHVIGLSEPKKQVRVHFRRRARIEKSVDINVTYIPRPNISVWLRDERVGRARVVRSLRGECGRWIYE